MCRAMDRSLHDSVTPVLISSTRVVHSKGMKKPEEHLSIDVHRLLDWVKVESVVHHLAKSLSKGITVNFVIKYTATHVKDHSDDESLSDSSEDDNPVPVKHVRRVRTFFSFFDN